MINWREGKAGFVGGSKRLIKGVLSFVYTLSTDNIVTPEGIEGVISTMTADGYGVTGNISTEFGVISTIENSGIISTMSIDGDFAISTMTADGAGIISTM